MKANFESGETAEVKPVKSELKARDGSVRQHHVELLLFIFGGSVEIDIYSVCVYSSATSIWFRSGRRRDGSTAQLPYAMCHVARESHHGGKYPGK